MLKIVRITEKSTGFLAVEYSIEIIKHNEFDTDFFDEAWLHAVYDGIVSREKRTGYSISFC